MATDNDGNETKMASVQIYNDDKKIWEAGTPLPEGMSGLGAVLLDNTVYSLGGATPLSRGGPTTVASIEVLSLDLADKKATWIKQPDMIVPRSSHGAVALDGQIYVAGGFNDVKPEAPSWGVMKSMSRFNPKASGGGAWTALLEMSTARMQFALVALEEGTPGVPPGGLLVAAAGRTIGSGVDEGITSSAEKYDPLKDEWSPIGSMKTPRYMCAGAALYGKVYVSGGKKSKDDDPLASVEMWDPANSQTWTPVTPMHLGRFMHSSICYRTKDSVSGASTCSLVVISGSLVNSDIALPEELECRPTPAPTPSPFRWEQISPMPPTPSSPTGSKVSQGMAAVSGMVVIMGGGVGDAPSPKSVYTTRDLRNVDAYNPLTNAWEPLSDMLIPPIAQAKGTGITQLAATAILGKVILVIGGKVLQPPTEKALSSVEALNLQQKNPKWSTSWTPGPYASPSSTPPLPSLNTARYSHSAATLTYLAPFKGTQRVFVAGGIDNNRNYLNTVESYDGHTRSSWITISPMSIRRAFFSLIAIDDDGEGPVPLLGILVAAGGINEDGVLSSVEIYRPSAKEWIPGPHLSTGRYGHAGASLHGKAYVMGGTDVGNKALSSVEVYDPVTKMWEPGPSMSRPRGGCVASTLNVEGMSRIYVTSTDGLTNDAEALGLWKKCNSSSSSLCDLCDVCCDSPASIPDGGECEACYWSNCVPSST